MKKKYLLYFALLLSIVFSGCGRNAEGPSAERPEINESSAEVVQDSREKSAYEMESSVAEISETEEVPENTSEDMANRGLEASAAEGQNGETDTPVVYMTTDLSSQGLMDIYQALSASPSGKIAVKLSTGEPGSNYLRTELIGELVESLEGTIVECNTAYGGSRANTAITTRWRRSMAIRPLRMWILWMRKAP